MTLRCPLNRGCAHSVNRILTRWFGEAETHVTGRPTHSMVSRSDHCKAATIYTQGHRRSLNILVNNFHLLKLFALPTID
jgi:hypothetical protein